jgi:hypothetical protein
MKCFLISNKMNNRVLSLSLISSILVGIFASCNNETAQDNNLGEDSLVTTQKDIVRDMPDISAWPEASQMASAMMMDKYGKPNESTEHMLVWYNNGPWKRTTIYNEETKHIFPVDHVDVMEQVINYKVPPNKFSDLAAYDGSVTVRMTDGELSAKCDKEGANFLAVNLANDVITGKKSVTEARNFYANAIKDFALQNKMSPYMESFQFTVSKGDTKFPDIHGVSEDENKKITEAMMKMAEKKK